MELVHVILNILKWAVISFFGLIAVYLIGYLFTKGAVNAMEKTFEDIMKKALKNKTNQQNKKDEQI